MKSDKVVHSKKVWGPRKNGMFGWMVKKNIEYKCRAKDTTERPEFLPGSSDTLGKNVGVFDVGPDRELMGASVHMYSREYLPGLSGMGQVQGADANKSESFCEGEKSDLD